MLVDDEKARLSAVLPAVRPGVTLPEPESVAFSKPLVSSKANRCVCVAVLNSGLVALLFWKA